MPRKVKAHVLVRMFDGTDEVTVRAAMRGASMKRRNERGELVVDNELDQDKGPPPKKPKKPKTPTPPKSPEAGKRAHDRFVAQVRQEIADAEKKKKGKP